MKLALQHQLEFESLHDRAKQQLTISGYKECNLGYYNKHSFRKKTWRHNQCTLITVLIQKHADTSSQKKNKETMMLNKTTPLGKEKCKSISNKFNILSFPSHCRNSSFPLYPFCCKTVFCCKTIDSIY